jgi:hypothetical protein
MYAHGGGNVEVSVYIQWLPTPHVKPLERRRNLSFALDDCHRPTEPCHRASGEHLSAGDPIKHLRERITRLRVRGGASTRPSAWHSRSEHGTLTGPARTGPGFSYRPED